MINKVVQFKRFAGNEVWKLLLISSLLGLIWFAVESSFILVLQGFLAALNLLQKSQILLPSWYPISVNSSVVILICFGALRSLLIMAKNYTATAAQMEFSSNQRKNLLKFGLENVSKTSQKEILTCFTEIVNQGSAMVFNISILMNCIVSAMLFFFMGLRLAPAEMVVGIIALAVCLLPLKKYIRKIDKHGKGTVTEWESITGILVNGFKNNFFLKVTNQIDTEVNKGSSRLDIYKNHFLGYAITSNISLAAPLFIGVCVLSLITYLSATYFETPGIKLMSFFYIFIRFSQSMSELNSVISTCRLNSHGYSELINWSQLSNSQHSKEKFPLVKFIDNSISITLDKVKFGYNLNKLIISDLSLKLGKGDVFVIKGESGVGKSTLLSLILGFLKPESGKILINDKDISELSPDFSEIISYVGPDPFLIQGSIRENLLYGKSLTTVINDQDLWNALSMVELESFIRTLPNGLDESLFEVAQISTGQKQRLSFARALVRRPKLLILDEATANIDPQTERKILQNIEFVLKDMTTICVSHKDAFDVIATQKLQLS